jgi:hypothetical protein
VRGTLGELPPGEESIMATTVIVPPDFESRLRLGLSEVLAEHPELREVLPLAAMIDDATRWCA